MKTIRLRNRWSDKFLTGKSSLTIFSFGAPLITITPTWYHTLYGGSDGDFYSVVRMLLNRRACGGSAFRLNYETTLLSRAL